MKLFALPISLCALALACPASAISAVLVYDEAVSGDLSDVGPTPSTLGLLDVGTNSVNGIMGGDPVDRDIFTFSVGPGTTLTSIELASYSVVSGSAGGGSFFTAGTGNTSDAPTAAGSFGFSITATPGELFASSLPAGPGDYTVWIQETAGGTIDYQVNFTVVPEPSSSLLLGLVGASFCLRRSRASK